MKEHAYLLKSELAKEMWKISSISLQKKKQQSGCLEIYFIEILYCIHLRQNKNLINNILSYTEIYFSKYRLAQTQILLMRVFRYQNPNEICLLKKVYNQIIIFVCY